MNLDATRSIITKLKPV